MTIDSRAMELLEEEGIDFSKPYELSHWMYFPAREAAEQLADDLRARGFRVVVTEGAPGSGWLLLAYHHVVVTDELLDEMRALLTELAEDFGGNYDGWEMAIPNAIH